MSTILYLGLAQFGRARVLGTRGRRFKSPIPDQSERLCLSVPHSKDDTLNKDYTDARRFGRFDSGYGSKAASKLAICYRRFKQYHRADHSVAGY